MFLSAVRAACALSAKVARGTLGPRKERSEGNSPKTNADDTNPSGPYVLLQALTAKLIRNSFFNFWFSIRSFRKARLKGLMISFSNAY